MRILFCLLLLLNLTINAQNDGAKEKKTNVLEDANDAARIAVAKQKLFAGEYVSALNSFREIEKTSPQNAAVKYYTGLCYYNLKQNANAKESLQRAISIGKDVKPETYLLLARIWQAEENFDEATSSLNRFKSSGETDKDMNAEAEMLLSQCATARRLMAAPLEVDVMNLGAALNSRYDDKNPCVTADGSTLIFTTRRPETTSSPVDVEGDGKYFENIYVSYADSATREFTKAEGVSRMINTDAHDACTSISPDGKQIFIYRNDAGRKESRGGNVFVSKIANGKWRKPESLDKPINSSYWEGGACISPDGKRYFFSSEREGGYGLSDIWMVEKKSKTEWDKPVNLGPLVNTEYDEAGMFLAPDGKTLFFCSNGPGSMGSYDIFKTVYADGKWSQPENVGYPINSASKEGQLTLSTDARYAYISSDRKGGLGESDLYRIDLKEYAILEKDGRRSPNGLSIVRGTIRDGNEGYAVPEAEVTLKGDDGTVQSTATSETGEYFFTVPGGNYQLSVKKKGYQEISEEVKVGASGKNATIVEKGYLLKK